MTSLYWDSPQDAIGATGQHIRAAYWSVWSMRYVYRYILINIRNIIWYFTCDVLLKPIYAFHVFLFKTLNRVIIRVSDRIYHTYNYECYLSGLGHMFMAMFMMEMEPRHLQVKVNATYSVFICFHVQLYRDHHQVYHGWNCLCVVVQMLGLAEWWEFSQVWEFMLILSSWQNLSAYLWHGNLPCR